jgi:glycosyltransferase involved in cell wall biosynthesis
MNVTSVLSTGGSQVSGGLRIVYEYANRLVDRGYGVTLAHASYRIQGDRDPRSLVRQGLVFAGKRIGLKGGYRPDEWFRLDPRIRILWLPSQHPRWVTDSDVLVATTWQSAEWVHTYPNRKGRQVHFIQGRDTLHKGWMGGEAERELAAWQLPLNKIVISKWLHDIVTEMGGTADYIPNGLNFGEFGIDSAPVERQPTRIVMLYHQSAGKGTEDGLAALALARHQIPDLTVRLFGRFDPPNCLPAWISYSRCPERVELRRLYNESAVFVGPSWSEGWPLPPAEAAQCGAALCLTDIGGHREYGIHEETALLSPVGDIEGLASNICRLVCDSQLRWRLAESGWEHVQQFTWERAVTSFAAVMEGVVRHERRFRLPSHKRGA